MLVPYEKNETGKVVLSIRKNGRIGLNQVAKRILAANDYVVLYIDKEEKKIGVKPVAEGSAPGARKVKKPENDAFFLAEDFLTDFKLKNLERKPLKCTWDSATSMFIVDYSDVQGESHLEEAI